MNLREQKIPGISDWRSDRQESIPHVHFIRMEIRVVHTSNSHGLFVVAGGMLQSTEGMLDIMY